MLYCTKITHYEVHCRQTIFTCLLKLHGQCTLQSCLNYNILILFQAVPLADEPINTSFTGGKSKKGDNTPSDKKEDGKKTLCKPVPEEGQCPSHRNMMGTMCDSELNYIAKLNNCSYDKGTIVRNYVILFFFSPCPT